MNELALRELALFAGAGGGILGGHLLGWRTVCAVEWADYPRKVLLARQRDGILPRFPIWDDVSTFDGRPWAGRVDIVSGGFPCQDISAAGKGAGIEGERSGMWKHMARVVNEVRPRFVFVENSPMLTSRGLGVVLGDLAKMGYDARWCVLGADDAGAPHRRKRIWILAYTNSARGGNYRTKDKGRESRTTGSESIQPKDREAYTRDSKQGSSNMAYTKSTGTRQDNRGLRKGISGACRGEGTATEVADTMHKGLQGQLECRQGGRESRRLTPTHSGIQKGKAWWEADPADAAKPELGRVAHGVAHRVDRLKAIGNGQVPSVAALAFTILSKGLK